MAYTVEDGTGSIDVRQWLDQDIQDNESERHRRTQLMYVVWVIEVEETLLSFSFN